MAAVRDSTRGERLTICADVRHPSSPANKSLRGSRGPEAGVRGIPSPFINLDERGRDTPHPSLLPLVPMRKDFLDGGTSEWSRVGTAKACRAASGSRWRH